MDAYGSHQSVLVKYVMKTKGVVVELGMGDYSTPILHEICKEQGRVLISAEGNKEWAERFYRYRDTLHTVEYVYDWDKYINWLLNCIQGISVIFVDHAPGERRTSDILKLQDKADYLIVHDSDEIGYKYDFSVFKYKKQYYDYPPATMVCSKYNEIL